MIVFEKRFDLLLDLTCSESEKRDGNMFYKSIFVGPQIHQVIRKFGDKIWHKNYPLLYEELFEEPDWTLEKRREYKEKIIKKFQLSKEDQDIVIVLMKMPRGEIIHIIFRYTDKISALLKDVSRIKVSRPLINFEKFSSMIRSFNFYKDVTLGNKEVINIRLNTQIQKQLFPHVILDIIMMRRDYRLIFTYKEASFFFDRSNRIYFLGWKGIPIRFEIIPGSEITIISTGVFENEEIIQEFDKDLRNLLSSYEKEHETVITEYDNLLGSSVSFINSIYHTFTLEKRATIENLRASVPELFIGGYSRECPNKPFIVNEEEAKHLNSLGRKTLVYPPKEGDLGRFSRIYACAEGFRPGLKRNRLSNSNIFEYIPVCYSNLSTQSPKPKVKSNKENQSFESKINQPLEKDRIGFAPKFIRDLFSNNLDSRRKGIARGPCSFLDCIVQDNPSEGEKELLKSLYSNEFIDPRIYKDLFNERNIYLFEINKGEITMFLSEKEIGSEAIQPKNVSVTSILFFKDVIPFHCELLQGLDISLLKRYKDSLMDEINKISRQKEILLQGHKDNYIINLEKRIKAYFIHDLVLILGNYHPDGPKGDRKSVV